MQQNTLSTTLSFGGGEGGGDGVLQDLEIAGRLVDKHLNYDSSFPSLLDMLRVSPQGSATVSGLSESDYPNSGDPRSIRHLSFTRKVPLPSELMHHFQRILFLASQLLKYSIFVLCLILLM
ncbi:nuclear pore complex protein Nup155-like isoform X2 [Penaeus monodon]|nr:nuclear pore complex protein Nup155-like isoform X2 [Penaeus monodon]